MADDKADELNKADRKRKWTESWIFFRLSATSMSAGILLVLVPSTGPVLPLISFLLFLASTLFLITEWSRLSEAKWRKSRENIKWFGELITPIFIIVSIASVIINWAKIMSLIYGGTDSSPLPTPTWVHRFYSQAFLYWIIFFVLTLVASVLKMETSIVRKRPLRQVLKRGGLILMLVAGVIVAFRLAMTDIVEAGLRDVLVFFIIFLIMSIAYYLIRDKNTPNRGR